MIDSIRFISEIKEKNLLKEKWNKIVNVQEEYYEVFCRTVRIAFYPITNSLVISGRIIGINYWDKVSNFDDVFTKRKELINFFKDVNRKLNKYLIGIEINVMTLKITKIDYCFNIYTPYMEKYITFFNRCYEKNVNGKFNNYINHTVEHNLEPNTSFYLKTLSEYYNRTNRIFTINFYNKQDQLTKKRIEEIENRGFSNIKDNDIISATNILRLEVQVGYNLLKSTCKKKHIPFHKRCLYNLCDINVARDVIAHQVKRFFTSCDFYSYRRTKEILIENGFPQNDKIYEYILKIAHNYNTSSYKRYEKILKSLNIYPYMFIPTKWNIDKLDNPIKLIDKKIKENNLTGLKIKN